MGKRAFPPLPTRPQLVAVYPALFLLSLLLPSSSSQYRYRLGKAAHYRFRATLPFFRNRNELPVSRSGQVLIHKQPDRCRLTLKAEVLYGGEDARFRAFSFSSQGCCVLVTIHNGRVLVKLLPNKYGGELCLSV